MQDWRVVGIMWTIHGLVGRVGLCGIEESWTDVAGRAS